MITGGAVCRADGTGEPEAGGRGQCVGTSACAAAAVVDHPMHNPALCPNRSLSLSCFHAPPTMAHGNHHRWHAAWSLPPRYNESRVRPAKCACAHTRLAQTINPRRSGWFALLVAPFRDGVLLCVSLLLARRDARPSPRARRGRRLPPPRTRSTPTTPSAERARACVWWWWGGGAGPADEGGLLRGGPEPAEKGVTPTGRVVARISKKRML